MIDLLILVLDHPAMITLSNPVNNFLSSVIYSCLGTVISSLDERPDTVQGFKGYFLPCLSFIPRAWIFWRQWLRRSCHAIAPDTGDPRFEPHHWQNNKSVNARGLTKLKKKEAGNGTFKKLVNLPDCFLYREATNPGGHGPWWWSRGQRPRLLLQRSEFEKLLKLLKQFSMQIYENK